jgi:predicted MPP superfamily phosphohydrolase
VLKGRKWRLVLGFTAGAIAAAGLYGFWYEPSSLRVVNHPIQLAEDARVSTAPLRIAVIADLHAGSPYVGLDKIDEIVARTNAAQPDLILLTGDYIINRVIGGRYIPMPQITDRLRNLSAPLGVYAVLGNHENADDPKGAPRAFKAAGIPLLENESVMVKHGGGALHLIGLSNYRRRQGARFAPALARLPADARAICFTHSPDIFPLLPAQCALTIAGHTHGGQVWLPVLGRPVVPSRHGQRYAAGHLVENGKHLFVSTGIGTCMIPVRFGVPPEVSLLEVR